VDLAPIEALSEDQTTAPYMTPRLARWRHATDGPLLVIAVASLPMLLLELRRSDLAYHDRLLLDAVNVLVLVAFAVDYFVELALAQHRRQFVRREWTSAAIVVAQAIALVPGLAGFGVLRAARAARLFRIMAVVLRLFAIGGAAAQDGRALIRRRSARFALSLAAFTWLTSAVAFTLAEDVGQGRRIESFGEALWWSTATITTVGYGDVFPVTAVGRLIGGITMLVGISAFAVVTAKIAEFLMRSDAVGE
jgi:voltage-gated potassium channel